MPQPLTLSDRERVALIDAIALYGAARVAKLIGIGREAVARLAANIPCRAGTVAIVQREIPKLRELCRAA